jgi:hypothetical protein
MLGPPQDWQDCHDDQLFNSPLKFAFATEVLQCL